MEENEIISVESINTYRSKNTFSSNGDKSNNYSDFVYNIDEILKSDNINNNNQYNDKISLNDYKLDIINSFRINRINTIKRIMSLNNDYNKNNIRIYNNKTIIKNSKSYKIFNNILGQKNEFNEFKINTKISTNNINENKNNNNYINRNSNNNINNSNESDNNDDKNNSNSVCNNKNYVNNDDNINKNIYKIKSISSEIMTDIEIEETSNRNKISNNNNSNKIIENNKIDNNNINYEEKKDNINNEDEINYSHDMIDSISYPNLYNEIEKQITVIKKSKKQNNTNVIENNKQIIELLSKINILYNLSEDDGKYKNIFKQVLDKIIYYFNNKNSIEIMNLFTEIKEKQRINISFKKEYQKLINNKPYKDKSLIDERKSMEYKDNLKIYNDLNNKIVNMEKKLENLKQKLYLYKEKENNENIQNYIGNKGEYEEYKLKQSLLVYDNTIKKLKEDINEKEKELNFLNNNNNIL